MSSDPAGETVLASRTIAVHLERAPHARVTSSVTSATRDARP